MGKLSFGLDLGQDTLKMYFAYPHDEYNFELGESEWGATCKHSVKSGIVLLDGMEAYPAVAFYDSGKDSWVFGESALNGACNSQKPIVGIKEILKNCDKPSVFSGKHFVNSSCGYEFNAKTDTQEMLVQKFLTFVLNDLKEAYMRSIGFLAQDDVSVSKEVEFTFPSTASDNYKITLKKMIEETGHTVKAVAEPTAAAICCLSEDVKLGNLTMVVDIGEDISSVGLFSPQTGLSQSSDMRKVETISIGGNDFDNELIKYIEAHCGREEELTNYQQFMLRQDAKSAKEYLCSGAALATIEYQSDAVVNVNVDAGTFDDTTNKMSKEFAKQLTMLLKKNDRVDAVIFTGGGSKNFFLISKLKDAIKKCRAGVRIVELKNGLFGVAKGAAVHATGVFKLTTITTKSYGEQCVGRDKVNKGMAIIIEKNTKLPCQQEKSFFTTTLGGSVGMCVRCSDFTGAETPVRDFFEQTNLLPLDKTTVLSEGTMTFNAQAPAGTEIVETIFIDENGIGRVSVTNPKGLGTYVASFTIGN